MTDLPPEDPGTTERVRGFVARARRAPAAVEGLSQETQHLSAALVEVRAHLDRLEELTWAARHDTQGGVTAVGTELHALDRHLDAVEDAVAHLDGSLAGHATALHRAVAAPTRQTAARALLSVLGPPASVVPGLSIFTLAWNHGELLGESIASGLACLDRLPAGEQGELLVLDDASTDSTPHVTAAASAADPRVRVIRSSVNLGLGLARSTLLHTVRTAHAFHLDADNTAEPEGVEAIYRAAVGTGAALTYGTVVQVGPDGAALGPISNEPPTPALFRSNYLDTMAVTDVAALRALGGWTSDPLLEHVDDWATAHHVATAGMLLAFVPVLVGHYRVLDTAFHRTVSDPRLGAQRVSRVYDPTGRLRGTDPLAGVAAVAVDPIAGPLWATPAAVRLRPDLAPTPPPPPPPQADHGRRVLVIAPGGVRNLGDDAITEASLARVRDLVGPDVGLDLVTDGPDLTPGVAGARWLGPLRDAVAGLGYDQLGRLDAPLAAAAEACRAGEARWRPLDPSAWRAAVFLGGGSLVSGWAEGLVAPRALLAAALRQAQVPYVLSGQGIGPLEGADDRALVAGLVGGADAVACRDDGSASVARALPGVDPSRVSVTGDDALWLPRATPAPGAPTLVVTVRRGDYVAEGPDAARSWMAAADALAARQGWQVRGVALNRQDPEPELATLAGVLATLPTAASWQLVDCGADVARLTTEVARAEAVVTQSYHAALFALVAGRPAVLGAATPYYQAKAAGLAAVAALPGALAVGHPAEVEAALEVVGAALLARPDPLAAARAQVEAWWAQREPLLMGRQG